MMDTAIEHIIKNNAFDHLTPEDRRLIEPYAADRSSYEQLQTLLNEAAGMTSDVFAPKGLEDKVMAEYRAVFPAKKKGRVFWLHPGVLSAAAVVLVALILFPLVRDGKKQIAETNGRLTPEVSKQVKVEPSKTAEAQRENNVEVLNLEKETVTQPTKSLASMEPVEKIYPEETVDITEDIEEELAEVDQIQNDVVLEEEPLAAPSNVRMATLSLVERFDHPDVLGKHQILKKNQQLLNHKPSVLDFLQPIF